MKRFLFLLLLFFAVPCHAQEWREARLWPYVAGAVAASAESTLKQDLAPSPDDYNYINAAVGYDYTGYSFTASSSYTVTRIDVGWQEQTGSPLSSAKTLYITSDCTLGSAASLLGTSTNTVSSTLTSGNVYYQFNFAGVALTNGTRYCVVTGSTIDASNVGRWNGDSGGDEKAMRNTDLTDSGFAQVQASIQGTMKIYGY